MNRTKFITVFIILIVIVTGVSLWLYSLSYHKITISLADGISVNIYNSTDKDKTTIKSLKSTSNISLQKGSYCAKPQSENFDATPICFDVKDKDMTVRVDPGYTETYLSRLLDNELVNISHIINTKYNEVISQYIVAAGKLFNKGEWYGTTLTQIVAPNERGDIYRVLLKKDGTNWNIVAAPQIVLNKYDYPTVPFSILSSINKLTDVIN